MLGCLHQKRTSEFNRTVGCVPHYQAALDGYISTGGKRLAHYLMDAVDLRIVRGDQEGAAEVLVSGTTPYGVATLALIPQEGHRVARAVLGKTGNDRLCLEHRLADQQVDPIRGELTGWKAVLFDVKAQLIDGAWIATSGRLVITETFPKGEAIQDYTFVRDRIELIPKFEPDDFRTDLLQGTRLTNLDDQGSGVQYVWGDGKPVAVK